MSGRKVPEWVASHPDQAIPARVKLRIWERCEGRCAMTGRKLGPGDAYDFEHEIPLSMGGRHAELNIRIVERSAHREKTAAEAGPRAKADRQRLKHLGLFPKSKTPLRGRPFPSTRIIAKD